jgi:transposase, IS30 family
VVKIQGKAHENTNGLLREYFPKGIGLSDYNQDYLDAVAFELNGRPRQTLGWRKPSEKLNAILLEAGGASTAETALLSDLINHKPADTYHKQRGS